MQKKLLSVAVAGALALPASAMAVEVFGTIDTGIRSASKVVTATGDDSLVSVTEGARTTNRWGFRGSEDLGGGLMANYWFEGQYASDSGGGPGSSAGGANQGIFQRKNLVGLSKGGMSIDLGRDYTVNFKTQGIYDPMSYTYTGITPSAGTNVSGTRSSNLVTAGFRFGTGGIRVDYAMGEVAGDNGSGTRMGLNGDFAFGPVTVAAAYSTLSFDAGGATGDVTTDNMNIGFAWKLGAFTFRGGYSTTEYSTDANSDVADTPMVLLGVQYAFSPTLNGRVGFYDTKYNVGGTEVGSRDLAIIALDYYLSKRTTLYVAFDRHGIEGTTVSVSGNTGAITLGTAGQAAVLGANSNDGATGFSVGIAHSF